MKNLLDIKIDNMEYSGLMEYNLYLVGHPGNWRRAAHERCSRHLDKVNITIDLNHQWVSHLAISKRRIPTLRLKPAVGCY